MEIDRERAREREMNGEVEMDENVAATTNNNPTESSLTVIKPGSSSQKLVQPKLKKNVIENNFVVFVQVNILHQNFQKLILNFWLIRFVPSALTTNNIQYRMDQNSSDPDSNELTSGTSGTSPTLKVNDPPELCSICLEVVIMLDVQTFKICTGCGNYMHEKCKSKTNHAGKSTSYLEEEEEIKKLISSSDCLMCHSEEAQPGSEEEIKRLRVWCSKKKPWAQEMLADRYSQGIGVSQDYERAY